jgi:hypothetical protein
MHQLCERLACDFFRQAAAGRLSVREACSDELCTQGQPCTLLEDFSTFNKSVTERLSSVLVDHSVRDSELTESWLSTVCACMIDMNTNDGVLSGFGECLSHALCLSFELFSGASQGF